MPKTSKITFTVNVILQRLNDKQFMHVIYTIFNTIRLCCKQCRTNGGEQVGSNWLPSDFSELKRVLSYVVTLNWQYHTSGLNKDNFLFRM